MRVRTFLFTLAIVSAADMAAAQIRVPPTTVRRIPARPRPARNFVAINVGYQDIKPFVQSQTFDQYFEQGSFELNRKLTQPIFFDASAGAEVWQRLQFMIAFSFLSNTGPSSLTASVPHPLHFNQHRSTSGEVARVQRREFGYHIGAGWRVTTVPNLDFTVFGGPSIFAIDQVMVTGLGVTLAQETFPFDTLPFPTVDTDSVTENAYGYHAGVDATWRFSRRFGVGLLLRYANARKDFAATDGGQTTEIEAGGLHAGAGLRVNF